ncbi:NOP5/NOP56 family protein [Natronosalvus caseinilyticus]|uniref:NOP5/NOP56 family protein n=1 Tax=Natronosalvus caseinilyticus TaxID=2953747 RepID=UPI0028B1806A|nr:NOP5/NOP56 family protein [Natronosalvus caseinilyticus]
MSGDGWFVDGDFEASRARVRTGTAAEPADWPTEAVEAGFAADRSAYYDALHEATVEATTAAVRERERADDQQLVHAVRALDDCRRTANELAERLAEWAGTVDPDAGSGVEYARSLAGGERSGDDVDETPGKDVGDPIQSLAARVTDLADEADSLEAYVERRAPTVAPNLSALAGPLLAARLLSLAGGLETLAKKPSGTVQVLGAEEALFAHLRGHATSPKHGIIFTHEAVRGTRLEDRGSAARALAGKLTIAARIDHYSGDYRPELEAELAERLETIRARAEGDGDGGRDGGRDRGGDDE